MFELLLPFFVLVLFLVALYIIWRLLETRPTESLWGLGTVVLGIVFYFLVRKNECNAASLKGKSD